MNQRTVTVFGGTGFLGRRVVAKLAEAGFRPRVAARDPNAAKFSDVEPSRLERVSADIRDEPTVAEALEGATAAVNAVSLYAERDELTFRSIHVDGAERVARHCQQAGVEALVHISGIGSDPDSESKLIRAKAEGERVVREQFERATIFRPSVMFGRDDAFLSGIEKATRPPVVPLFGRGLVKQQPAYVQDVAQAGVNAITGNGAHGKIFELGGAQVLTYREAVEAVCDALGRVRLLVPFPMELWRVLTRAMKVLPEPPLTIDQLYLLAADNTVSPGSATFADLGIEPCSVLDCIDDCLKK